MPDLLRSARVSLALLLLWFACCCPPRLPPQAIEGPESALREYAQHLKNKRTDQAYELLSSSTKKHLGRKQLRRFLTDNGERLAALLELFYSTSKVEVAVRATLRSNNGDEVQLVHEKGAWRVDSGALVPPTGVTPQTAVERFLLAVEAKNCEALLECAPPPTRARHPRKQLLAGCREQIGSLQETAAQIRAAGVKPVMVTKTRAELTYLGTHKLIVVEYRGRWYIEDLL